MVTDGTPLERINLNKLQTRARIFVEQFGYWRNLDYILWINYWSSQYKNEKGEDLIRDHDDFTEFLRGKPFQTFRTERKQKG